MTMLDDRARAAAAAIHESVAEYAPAAPMPVLVRRQTMWQSLQWAAATAAAVVAIAGVALLATPADDDEVTEPTLPETVTTVPDVTPTTVVERDVAPVDVTTTTAAPAPIVPVAPPTTAADTTPPPLAITSPAPDSHFDTKFVTFTGETEPGATVVAAGKFAATVDGEGRWSIQLVLAPGKNGASFVAADAAGNTASASIVVWYDVPVAEPKEEEPKATVSFTAYKTYGSCSESPPYDVYYGTAEPGTTVEILSPYGSGSVTADADGNWEKKVHFETAPYGEVFQVKVKDHTGAKKVFDFVSYAAG